MVKLTIQLLDLLSHLGIVDTSLCSACLDAQARRSRAAAEAAYRAATIEQTNVTGGKKIKRNMWSSLDLERRKGPASLTGTMATKNGTGTQTLSFAGTTTTTSELGAAASSSTKKLTSFDNLLSLHGSLAALDLNDTEVAHYYDAPSFGDADCPVCHGQGRDRRAHFGYAEEREVHTLETPGAGGTKASTAFSPEAQALRVLMMEERNLTSILRNKADLKKEARINTMNHNPLGNSTTLIKKQPSASGPVVEIPTDIPERTKEWLWQVWKELKFEPVVTSLNPLPPITSLDSDFAKFINLHTLHISGQQLSVLENLPKNIKVVQAYGNRIESVRLKKPPAQIEAATSPRSPIQKSLTSPTKSQRPRSPSLVKKAALPSFSPHARKPGVVSIADKLGLDPTVPVRPIPGAKPKPVPPPIVSAYPHLMHLGLGYNNLTSVQSLLPVAGTLVSLDLSWNCLCDLMETCQLLSEFKRLHTLHLNGNPLAFHKYYRAAIMDVFANIPAPVVVSTVVSANPAASLTKAPSTPSIHQGVLEMLDGFHVTTHLQKLASAAPPPPPPVVVSTESSAKGAATKSRHKSISVSSKKKLTAFELEMEQQQQRDALIRASEEAKRLEEERIQSGKLHPTPEQLQEKVTLLFVLSGLVKGLTNPAEQFRRDYPAPSDETSGKGGKKGRGSLEQGSLNRVPSPQTPTSGGGGLASPKSKKHGKNQEVEVVNPADIGWFITETRSEVLTPAGDTIRTHTKIRKQVRYYFEFRLVHDPTAQVEQENEAINFQDGNSADPICNATGIVNQGNQRGQPQELFRTIEYDFETLTTPSASSTLPGTPPVPNSALPSELQGSPASFHSQGLAYVKELSLLPSTNWRNFFAHQGVDMLLYQKEITETQVETVTTIPAKERAETPVETKSSKRGSTGKLNPKKMAAGESGSADPSTPSKKKADGKSSASKKNKKGGATDLPPPEIQTTTSSDSSELHTLLGFSHIDLAPFLNVYPSKNLTSLILSQPDLVFHRAPGQQLALVNGVASTSAQGLPPKQVDPSQWNPQEERRLPVELPPVEKYVTAALQKAKEEGTPIPFKPLVRPPPEREESKEQMISIPLPSPTSSSSTADRPSKSSRGRGEKQTEEQAREHALAQAAHQQQLIDPIYTLASAAIYLNCRPTTQGAPGSLSFKQPPPEPTPEERAAALAAQQAATAVGGSRRERKASMMAGGGRSERKSIAIPPTIVAAPITEAEA